MKPNVLLPALLLTFLAYACNNGGDESATSAAGEASTQKEQPKLEPAKAKPQTQLEKDQAKIEGYLSENKLEAKRTASGLYYIIETQGDGAPAEKGKTVAVHYTGRLLNGTKFDSSHDRGQPIEFVLGQGMVIRGWDEGIALLHQGGKGTLLIPSPLGYGSRDLGTIPPNSVLVFDVEVVEVK